ncbi:hypothetical protein, partial [Mesorhizobium sp.]
KADTAARNSLSAFPASVRIAMCLKSEEDTEDTPDTRHRPGPAPPAGPVSRLQGTNIKLAAIR